MHTDDRSLLRWD